MKSHGQETEAKNLENFLDKIDLGTYTDMLADNIADYVENNLLTN
jgi:hypothetical protein